MDPERWERIKELCCAALERDAPEREMFLDSACRGDTALRAEIAALLTFAPRATRFLETPAGVAVLPVDNAGSDLTGCRIMHYLVREKIGEGGMGVVYRAEDSRLGRSVALKFIPDALAGDRQALERLHREARSVSALNHARICTLYDVGEHEGRTFLVLEYLEGVTLAALLAKGPLPLQRALDIAIHIAEGLEAAHARGIVHRDLKPGNVMVTAAGAKLLDFGLAKGSEASASGSGEHVATSITGSAMILGTVPYMAPEQLEGMPVDARTDLWALGAIAYEMIAGKRAFDAPSQASLIASILDREPPPLAAIEPLTPPLLAHLVAKCLAKSPDERWASAHDVVNVLRWIRDSGAAASGFIPQPAKSRRSAVPAAVALAVVAALTAAMTLWIVKPSSQALAPSRRFTITLPPDKPLAPGGMMPEAADRPVLALSRDGTRLAYVAKLRDRDTTELCIRDMTSTGVVKSLPGTEGGHSPFFSPDGAYLGFFAEGKLKKTPSAGGPVVSLADAPNPYGGMWADDGWIYFARQPQEGIHKVRAEGGAVEVVTSGLARMPEKLPSGTGVLATTGDGTVLVEGPQKRSFVVRGYGARVSPTGHLVYALPGRLMAVAFDSSRPRSPGAATVLFDDLRTAPYGVAQFTYANDGTLVYATGRPETMTTLVWVDRQGRTRPAGLQEATYSTFDLSSDGTRVAIGLESADGRVTELRVFDLQHYGQSSLTARVTTGEAGWNAFPRWTPDGSAVVFFRRPTEQGVQLALQFTNGSAEPVELWSNARGAPGYLTPMGFSPDGSALLAFGPIKPGSMDIVRLLRDDRSGLWTSGPQMVLATPYSDYFGQVSPDGRWLLFVSDQTGRDEVYVTSYPTSGEMHKVSRDGGHKPAWNGASEIVYKFGTRMYSVDVAPGPDFRSAEPKLLFAGSFPNIPGFDFAVSPQRREFLMLENKDFLQPTTTLTVVTNFFDDLKRRVPAAQR